MSDPRPGDFGVVRVGGDGGALIRLGQWLNGDGPGDWEHAFVFTGPGQPGYVVEAEPGGAVMSSASRYGDVLWSSGVIPLTDAQRAAIVAAAKGYVGTPYSAADYFALAAHRLRLPGSRLLKGYVADSRHMICSQLVDQCYQDAGVKLFDDGRWPGYVTPGALADLILGSR